MATVTVDVIARVEFGRKVNSARVFPQIEFSGESMAFAPERTNYVPTDGSAVNQAQVDGGLPRTRRDVIGLTTLVQCEWLLSSADYETFQGFYQRRVTAKTNEAFFIQLVLDNPELETFSAFFVPGTFSLVGDSLDTKTVQAQLEVIPLAANEDYDLGFVDIYGAYGESSATFLARLAQFANVDLLLLN